MSDSTLRQSIRQRQINNLDSIESRKYHRELLRNGVHDMDEADFSKQYRKMIRYELQELPDGQCRMSIVEISVGWHKGLHDNKAIADATGEAIGGFRYTKKPGEDLDADVFVKASFEASSNLGNGVELLLMKAEASAEYNAFRDEITKKSSFSKPKFKANAKNLTADLEEKEVEYSLNGKIAALKLKRKNCN